MVEPPISYSYLESVRLPCGRDSLLPALQVAASEGPGLADEVRSDAIPDAAGGEGGHGAAKPDPVIHR